MGFKINNAGVEAPRNSLDMEEPTVGLNPAASKTMLPRLKQEEEEEEAKNLNNIPVSYRYFIRSIIKINISHFPIFYLWFQTFRERKTTFFFFCKVGNNEG